MRLPAAGCRQRRGQHSRRSSTGAGVNDSKGAAERAGLAKNASADAPECTGRIGDAGTTESTSRTAGEDLTAKRGASLPAGLWAQHQKGLPVTRARATFARAWSLLRDVRFEQIDPQRFYSHLGEDTAGMLSALIVDAASGHAAIPFTGAGRPGPDPRSGASPIKLSSANRPDTKTPSTNIFATDTESPYTLNFNTAGMNPLRKLRVLDVGGGPGYFARAFTRRGAHYFSVEPDVGEMAAAGINVERSVRGSGTQLPFASSVFDVAYSSNVAEHVARPDLMGDEMLRVTRPGGLVVISYTIWLGPFGGHETGLWAHYIGGHFARRRYLKKMGREPKNKFGESLFAVSCVRGIRWAKSMAARGDADIVGLFPRYHPGWAWWVTSIPLLREFAVSNLVIVLRRRSEQPSRRQ